MDRGFAIGGPQLQPSEAVMPDTISPLCMPDCTSDRCAWWPMQCIAKPSTAAALSAAAGPASAA